MSAAEIIPAIAPISRLIGYARSAPAAPTPEWLAGLEREAAKADDALHTLIDAATHPEAGR